MADFAQILEEELEEAVEVKNRKSLHRYITLLTRNIAGKEENRMEHTEFQQELLKIDGRFDQLITELREGFKHMDQRFETMQANMDQRFETMQANMNQRFESMQANMNQRFESMQANIDNRFEASDRHFEVQERQYNKRFSMMFSFITIGFVVLATMMSVFQILG